MNVQQVYQLVNTATSEVIGDSAVVNEDLSNTVDIGNAIFNANAFDNYVKSLVNHIGRVIFVNRPYSGNAPSVLMDSWEYGSILEKVSSEMPEAEENESWQLVDGTSYDPHIFRKPTVDAKFFNKRVTFEIDRSITEKQVRESFSNREQLNGFISMIFNEIDKSMTVKTDALIMRTINNFIGETFHDLDDSGSPIYSGKTGTRAINLLYMYNQAFTKTLTPQQAILDKDFIRYASLQIKLIMQRLKGISTMFNIGEHQRFTPVDRLHFVALNEFMSSAEIYLYNELDIQWTRFPKAEVVPFWQGSGVNYDFASTSSINIKTASGDSVSASGILAVLFDRDALGVTNFDRRVLTEFNTKAEFTNYFYKQDAGYFNDLNENFIVFYVA